MNTGFLATTIQRIARKRRTSTLLWLGGILIVILCFLGMLLLLQLPDAGFFYVFLILPALVVCGLIFMMSVPPLSRAIRNPLESFFINDLKRYGPLQQTIEQIDREAAPYTGKIGSFITQHWVISALSHSFNCMRLEEVVWVYKRLSESSVTFYYAITVSSGKSYAAQIWSRYGYSLTIPSTEQGVDALLVQIAKAVPWATQGYLELLNEAWYHRRAEFIADVDRKRQQILFVTSGASAAASASPLVSSPDAKPQSPQPPASPLSSLLPGLNRAVDEKLIEEYQTRQDRKLRASGCLVLVFGLGLSVIFILPLILGVLGNAKELFYSKEGICVSLFLLLAGVYYIAFGQKGKTFYETTLFRNWWTTALLVVLVGIGLIFFNSALESLLRFFGYGSVSP